MMASPWDYQTTCHVGSQTPELPGSGTRQHDGLAENVVEFGVRPRMGTA